jgi:K+-transporting ATPase ATPase C chain
MKTVLVSIKIFLLFTVLTGILYPCFVTGIAQLFFPYKANGSLVSKDNKIVGSALIGQPFDTCIYFNSRPSATNYDPLPSGGSNYSVTNKKLINLVASRKRTFVAENSLDSLVEIPAEMLFASASGLDPHISGDAALLQINRISKARNFNETQQQRLKQLIKNQTESSSIFWFGRERINVLLLNLELEKIR